MSVSSSYRQGENTEGKDKQKIVQNSLPSCVRHRHHHFVTQFHNHWEHVPLYGIYPPARHLNLYLHRWVLTIFSVFDLL